MSPMSIIALFGNSLRLCGCLAALSAALALASPAEAGSSPWHEAMGGKIRLITAGGSANEDGSLLAGLEIRPDPGWKTYWRFPGDSGLGTQADFAGSENLATAQMAFPAPARHVDPYSVTIGYEGPTVLPILVHPQSAEAPVSLTANVTMGLCKQVCVPVMTQLQVELTPGAPADAPQAASIRAALAKLPQLAQPGDPLSVSRVSVEGGAAPVLKMTAQLSDPDAPFDLFVEGPEGSYLSVPTLETQDGDRAFFSLSLDGLASADGKALLRLTLVNGDKAADQTWAIDVP